MDRCVVLVDAGYLLGASASLLAGEAHRSRITVDHTALIAGLRERAEAETGLPLLRIYWFDAAPDRRPLPEHRRLRVLPRVTVRLGALTRAEGRRVQKGVDAAMHAELSELARNRACADVVLITGDGDLLPGMMSAKEHGVVVHLWALQAADGDFNQSEDLVGEADERRVLDREWIERAVRLREVPAQCPPPGPRAGLADLFATAAPPYYGPAAEYGPRQEYGARQEYGRPPEYAPPQPAYVPPPDYVPPPEYGAAAGEYEPKPAFAEPGGAAGAAAAAVVVGGGAAGTAEAGAGGEPAVAVGPQPALRVVPTPKDLAIRSTPGHAPAAAPAPVSLVLRWSSDRGQIERPAGHPAGEQLPSLAQLTSSEQRWADREEDITTIGGDAHEVGQVFARRWTDRLAAPHRLAQLWADYPRIPHRLDGELLRYAARFGLLAHKDDQIDEHDRYAIRAGFWKELASRVPGAQPPPEEG
ncbi:NYN domain-containing protein [Kitasatospora sp. MMS16-BH015]|uniref:NYN domain-containing protein n=1 Tax=Kitasatospora sp. MMS16-BH015 TaxID=2018025 RepID=UPI000CF22EF1|nr:NYN domain-containing protein [Kitasatospora sp. MMS16-BH015]